MEIHYTEHAVLRMAKRAIEPEWIERVLRNPDLRVDDESDPELEHCVAIVPEIANRVCELLFPSRNQEG